MTEQWITLGLLILLVLAFAIDVAVRRRQRPRPPRVTQRPPEEAPGAKPLEGKAQEPVEPVPAAEAEPVEEPKVVEPAKEVPAAVEEVPAVEPVVAEAPVAEPEAEVSLFQRMRRGLAKTRGNLSQQLAGLVGAGKRIDDDVLEEIETLLLMADVGVTATTEIVQSLTDKLERKQLKDGEAVQAALKEDLHRILEHSTSPLQLSAEKKPFVILVVGVNGVGKTTTIGKLARRFQSEGKKVMLAAGDTFRAAAVEQLQVWGERNGVPVIAQHTGADSASVIFDAVQSAQARGIDVVIADTAGRLQNKDNLMSELQKVVRVMKKLDPEAPHEVMLVLDAGTGQNALSQAQVFQQAVGVSGITLTKLDGTAKGGIIFAIARQLQLPIRFIGVGEQIEDLRPFIAEEFVQALFD